MCVIPGADKSIARPGRKQARKHVWDARDFDNIETRAVMRFFFPLHDKAPKFQTSTLMRSGRRSALGGRIIKPRMCTARCLRPCFTQTTFWDLFLVPSGQILPYLDPSGQSPASHRGRLGLTPAPVYMGFMEDKVTLRHDILRVLRLPPVKITPPVLYDIYLGYLVTYKWVV